MKIQIMQFLCIYKFGIIQSIYHRNKPAEHADCRVWAIPLNRILRVAGNESKAIVILEELFDCAAVFYGHKRNFSVLYPIPWADNTLVSIMNTGIYHAVAHSDYNEVPLLLREFRHL